MNKYLKLSLILLLACISSFFIYENASAATLNQSPYFGYHYYYEGSNMVPVGASIYSSSWGSTPVWTSDATYYSFGGSTSPAPALIRFWWNKNLNLCNGGETILKGTFIIGDSLDWNNFRSFVKVGTTTYSDSKLCTYTIDSSNKSRLHFSCTISNWSNATGLNFYIVWNLLPLANAHIVLTRDLEYTCEISTSEVINNNNQNTQNIINNQNKNNKETNDNLNKIDDNLNKTNDYLKDDTAPKSDISSLGNVQGLLPAGPVDSLLNIPFEFLSILTSSFSDTCVDMSFNFVFDQRFTIPCFDSFYDDVPSALMLFINTIPSAFILITYFKHLYKKVDRAMSLETTDEDEWGVL